MRERFEMVGIRQMPKEEISSKEKWYHGKPVFAAAVLTIVIIGCLFCNLIMTKDPAYLDLENCNVPPCREFLFGTDTMGRDIFSMIWYGGRISLFIGIVATLISTVVAIIFGAVSGSAPKWADTLLMRLTDLLISVPGLLVIILLQAILGKASVLSLSFVIGITSWIAVAKVVRTEVLRLRGSEYVIASKCMGGGFFHVLWKHLTPNFISSIMFMIVMNIRSAIIAESTLSFMGIGLPVGVISWGSMLSLAEQALLTNAWWMIVIPGVFMLVTLLCITSIGNYMRKKVSRRQSNL
ncbi:MAG: ABC transporter permease [Lachnospiraceae bacterium]|nr:ABC transporter permease [Lachnospiraceae bacterium]